jgi:malonyl-CoA/methylmalonyl-CoA synthetase
LGFVATSGVDIVAPHFVSELLAVCVSSGGRPALRYRGRTIRYGDLERSIQGGAALLQRAGMQPGDRVAVLAEEKLPFLVSHLSILAGGGVSLPLNPRFTSEELRYFLKDSGARLAVAGAGERAAVERLRPELPALAEVLAAEAIGQTDATPRPVSPRAEDPCLILYSSGTTGWPKGIVHTNANVAASLRALQQCWRVTAEDAIVNVLPLFHIHGLSFATHLSLLSGSCLILEDAFHPQQTLQVVDAGTVFMAVPTIYYRFLEQPEFAGAARRWSDVRLFTCGSAPIRPEVLPRLEEMLGRPVINRYGMTEAHVISSLPLDGPWPQGSVGLPLAGVELCVRGEDSQAVAVGGPGRVLVRGPNLFREYWGQPEATRQAWATGWFDTGDVGSLDERGFLTLVGRTNEMIITSGYNVYPQVVERVLNSCPGVREAAVFGAADERRGERVAAAVVRGDPGLTETAILAYLSECLVEYQRPRQILFVDELPRNALGKIVRKELRERVEKML